MLIGIVVALIIEAFSTFNLDGDVETILGAVGVWILALATYFTAFWALTGQTPGMRALGIDVTALRRHAPVRAAVAAAPRRDGARRACRSSPATCLILLRDDRRGLHDLLARSVVRYAEEKRPARPLRGRR